MILLFSKVEGESAMLDSIKMAKLDWLAVKSYMKQMILSYLMITVILVTTLPYMLNVIYFIYGSTFLIYPFMVAEQNGMEKFYKMVAITKKGRVGSKYLEAILCLGITVALLIPINIIIYNIEEVKPSIYLLAGMLLIGVLFYCIVTSIQLPCCFKWGYAKSKVISMIMPIAIGIGVPALFYVLTRFMAKEEVWQLVDKIGDFIANNASGIFLGSLLIGGLSLFISYRVALKVCQ